VRESLHRQVAANARNGLGLVVQHLRRFQPHRSPHSHCSGDTPVILHHCPVIITNRWSFPCPTSSSLFHEGAANVSGHRQGGVSRCGVHDLMSLQVCYRQLFKLTPIYLISDIVEDLLTLDARWKPAKIGIKRAHDRRWKLERLMPVSSLYNILLDKVGNVPCYLVIHPLILSQCGKVPGIMRSSMLPPNTCHRHDPMLLYTGGYIAFS
jgi:hypothetical protein